MSKGISIHALFALAKLLCFRVYLFRKPGVIEPLRSCVLFGLFIVSPRSTETTLPVLSCNQIDVTFRKQGKKRKCIGSLLQRQQSHAKETVRYDRNLLFFIIDLYDRSFLQKKKTFLFMTMWSLQVGPSLTQDFFFSFYRPETKLRKGNVFTGICLSGGYGVYPIMPLGRGCGERRVWWNGGVVTGCEGGYGKRVYTISDGSQSGRYASFWNAFLLTGIWLR